MEKAFFSDWGQVLMTAAATSVVYACALAAVRLAGRRTVAELSAFDVVVTVAIGSVVATTALPRNPSVADGIAALVTLLLLQVIVAAARQRFPIAVRLLDFRPYVVASGSKVDIRRSPLTAQLTEDDVLSRLRLRGVFDLAEVEVVVLEANGEISVIPRGTALSAEMVAEINRRSDGEAPGDADPLKA